MQRIFLILVLLYSTISYSQNTCVLTDISLPAELKKGALQISGLYAHAGKIYLLGEHDKDANDPSQHIFSIDSNEISRSLTDANYVIRYHTLKIKNLDWALYEMGKKNESFDGLEAMVISNDTFYFSVETNWKNSQYCFLIRGRLTGNSIELDTNYLLPLKRPEDNIIKHVYNSGFEGLTLVDNYIYAFFEFNYFTDSAFNNVLRINTKSNEIDSINIRKPIPFRITDITNENDSTFYAINFFYNGTKEQIYRENLLPEERALIALNTGDTNNFKNFARIIKMHKKGNAFSWEPVGNFPENTLPEVNYTAWNWEGIARFRNGFLVINDQYRGDANQSTNLMFCDCGAETSSLKNTKSPGKKKRKRSK
jgi:hypothetical protein